MKANTGPKSRGTSFGTASRGTALLVFCLRMHAFPELKALPYSWDKVSAQV